MCSQLAINIMPSVLIGPFVIAFYTYETYVSSGGLGIAIIYGYYIVGAIVNKFLMSPMVKWSARVEKAEGDFRYKHVSIRNNAESIALYEAEPFEQYECNRIFILLWWRQFKFLCWKLPNLLWQQLYDHYGGILSYAVQFIPILIIGLYDDLPMQDLGRIISNNAFVYMYLINSFTQIADVALSTGEMAGVLQRVAELVQVCNYMGNTTIGHSGFVINSKFEEDDRDEQMMYSLHNVSYSVPNYHSTQRLLNDFSLTIRRNSKVWIKGPSGSGKTSLVRVLSQLWQCETDYASINSILSNLKLDWLVERCGGLFHPVEFEWQNTLTPSEQQRLAFARVLFQQPQLVILDESFSCIEPEIEEQIYQILISSDIGFISIGHHPSLIKFHDTIIHLDGCGTYKVRSLLPLSPTSTIDPISCNDFSNST
ncbi:unnamed protein product [Litomosoides sigmodontis]|uniref:ABC transporter domain-containing protein n=1 Tax=Litomosoides sigmodontis TaxID=42156 RepID=A0A3P6SKV1_LITSI|nr:unnamed protein product [Litomosoides sigmodontis]